MFPAYLETQTAQAASKFKFWGDWQHLDVPSAARALYWRRLPSRRRQSCLASERYQ